MKTRTDKSKIIAIIICLTVLISSSITVLAQNTMAQIGDEKIEETEINKISSDPFEFEILEKENNRAIIKLVTNTKNQYTFSISEKGTKNPCQSNV